MSLTPPQPRQSDKITPRPASNLTSTSETGLAPQGRAPLVRAIWDLTKQPIAWVGLTLVTIKPIVQVAYWLLDFFGNMLTLRDYYIYILAFLNTLWGTVFLMVLGFSLIALQLYKQQKHLRQEDTAKHQENIAKTIELAPLIECSEKGDKILRRCLRGEKGQHIESEFIIWEMDTGNLLKEKLGEAQAALFKSDAPIEEYPSQGTTAPNGKLLNRIYTRLARLNRFIEEERRG
jgi:hypothetical protein